MLAGIHHRDDVAALARRVGGNATRDFTANVIGPGDLVKRVQTVCGPAWAAGQTAVWSFKPSPAEVRSKEWKPAVTALGRWLRAHPENRTVVVVWHEPENDAPQYFRRPQDFVYLFNTVAGWLREACPGLVVVHAGLGYRYGDRRMDDAEAPLWRTEADVHALDIYSGRTNALDTILPELSGFNRWFRYLVDGAEWGLTERGWAAKKALWPARVKAIERERAWLLAQPKLPVMYLVWSTPGTEGDDTLVLDRTGETAAAATVAQLLAAQPPAPADPAGPATVTCPTCHGAGTVDAGPGRPAAIR